VDLFLKTVQPAHAVRPRAPVATSRNDIPGRDRRFRSRGQAGASVHADETVAWDDLRARPPTARRPLGDRDGKADSDPPASREEAHADADAYRDDDLEDMAIIDMQVRGLKWGCPAPCCLRLQPTLALVLTQQPDQRSRSWAICTT
jgi:hypothetical protein